MTYVDPVLLAKLKGLLAAAEHRYTESNRKGRVYRYKGTTFRTVNERNTDGWFNAWERAVAKKRRKRKPR